MPKLSIRRWLLASILAVTFGAPWAKPDDITQVFSGFTFNAVTGQHTSTLSGFLTVDTGLLPPPNTSAYANVDPFSAFALTLTEADGTVINYDSLSTSFVLTHYGGNAGCGYLSGANMPCQTLLTFTSGGDPNLDFSMTITNYFDQQVGINYDDTDAPWALAQNGSPSIVRGTFTETPEPATLALFAVGLLGLAAFSLVRRS